MSAGFSEAKARLSPLEYQVTQEKATERPFSNKYNRHWAEGTYHCIVCETELFRSDYKFESKSGWPAFSNVVHSDRVKLSPDTSNVGGNILLLISRPDLVRTSVSCAKCNAHLGHLFKDGPKPTGLRYCINSSSLNFKPLNSDDYDSKNISSSNSNITANIKTISGDNCQKTADFRHKTGQNSTNSDKIINEKNNVDFNNKILTADSNPSNLLDTKCDNIKTADSEIKSRVEKTADLKNRFFSSSASSNPKSSFLNDKNGPLVNSKFNKTADLKNPTNKSSFDGKSLVPNSNKSLASFKFTPQTINNCLSGGKICFFPTGGGGSEKTNLFKFERDKNKNEEKKLLTATQAARKHFERISKSPLPLPILKESTL